MSGLQNEIEAMDPTRSGAPVPDDKGTSVPDDKGARLSLNEIEQLCLKAARGAGMSWGLAEEAGFAAVWLARQGLDGPGALLTQLTVAQGRAWQDICPVVEPGAFRAARGGSLCPIALGSALCDHMALPETQSDRLRIGPVTQPILLLPFLSEMARAWQRDIRMVWPAGTVAIHADGHVTADQEALATAGPLAADLLSATRGRQQRPAAGAPPVVSADTLGALNALAMRITVPASEVSRAGAGAAMDDD